VPSPIAHSVVPALGFLWLRRDLKTASFWKQTLFLVGGVALAVLPDADFLPGFVLGDPVRYHRGATHSLLVCLVAALALSPFFRAGLPEIRRGAVTVFCVFCVCSHPLLDCLAADVSEPYGIALFWPLSEKRFLSPISLFPPVHRLPGPAWTFVTSLANMANVRGWVVEVLFSATALLAGVALYRRSDRIFLLASAAGSLFCLALYWLLQMG